MQKLDLFCRPRKPTLRRKNRLTFAAIFVVAADPVAVGNVERGVAVQEGRHPVGQGPVVEVVELAVVVGARGGARVQVGAAEELALNGAGTSASLKTV